MYTTMFSLLLASAGLASGAQEGGYGGFGSYGTYSGSSGACYPYYGGAGYVMPWTPQYSQANDPNKKEQDKRFAELTQKLADLEKRFEKNGFDELRREIAESNMKMQDKLNDAIGKINDTFDRRLAEAAKLLETKTASVPGPGPGPGPMLPGNAATGGVPGLPGGLPSIGSLPGANGPGTPPMGPAGPMGPGGPMGPAGPIGPVGGTGVAPAGPYGETRSDPILAKILDAIEGNNRRFSELEMKIRIMEERQSTQHMDAGFKETNAAVLRILDVLAAQNASHNNNASNTRANEENIRLLMEIKDIRDKMDKMREHFEVKVKTEPMRVGGDLSRGLIIVKLPADAKLWVDGMPSTPGANLRTFISPILEPGKNYFYSLRVEVERSGKVYSDNQKIFFQAGREVHVSFESIDAAIANRQQ